MLPVIHIGGIEIESFKLFLVLGFLGGSLVLFYQNSRLKLVSQGYLFFSLCLMFFSGIVGAQIHYIIFHPDWAHLLDFKGDSSWHKGLITGILVYWVLFRLKGISTLRALDFLAPAIPFGHAIGRLGCFFAGDGCYGVPTDLPWGMSFPHGAAPILVKVHPVPLYESIILIPIFIFMIKASRKSMQPGTVFAGYTLLVGSERILLEELRLNSPIFLGLTQPQLVYGLLMTSGVIILLTQYRKEIHALMKTTRLYLINKWEELRKTHP